MQQRHMWLTPAPRRPRPSDRPPSTNAGRTLSGRWPPRSSRRSGPWRPCRTLATPPMCWVRGRRKQEPAPGEPGSGAFPLGQRRGWRLGQAGGAGGAGRGAGPRPTGRRRCRNTMRGEGAPPEQQAALGSLPRSPTGAGVILGGGAGSRLYPLTKSRAKPAVPIGGAYRLIDVPMSNCINSGINK